MELRLRVTQNGETYEVVTTPLSLIRWERRTKQKVTALTDGNIGLEDLAVMAYEASRVAGRPVPANLDDWLAKLDAIDPLGDETPDPTQPAPLDD